MKILSAENRTNHLAIMEQKYIFCTHQVSTTGLIFNSSTFSFDAFFFLFSVAIIKHQCYFPKISGIILIF